MTAANLSPYLVVTGAVDLTAVLPDAVETVANPDWASGMATSLRLAVQWARNRGLDAVVVGLGDQPGVLASAWRAIADADAVPIVVATYNGRRGHPVRLHRDVWGRLPADGDAGARAVMRESPQLVCEVACDGDPADVDTVEDLNRWR